MRLRLKQNRKHHGADEEMEMRIMEFFIGLLFGVATCVIATIPAEKDYGQLMYIRGYSKALEDMEKKKNGEEKQRI